MEPRIAPRPPTASEPDACQGAKASENRALSWGKILPLVVIVGAAVLVFAMGWHRKLSVEALASHRAALDHFIGAHFVLALASYVGIYILAAALSLPGSLFLTITGGILFGWFIGGLAAALGASIGATILFLVARTALYDFVRQKAGPRVQKLAAGFRADALNYLLFLRLVPLFPFWLVNIAAALLGVALATFVIGTSIGILPATFAFAFVGAGLDSVLAAQQQVYQACLAAGNAGCRPDFSLKAAATPQLLLALTALGVLAIVPVILKRLRSRQQFWPMAELLTPDICVIGAGSGGLSVAAAAASFGVSVVLIERGKMGGDCLNYGCVPSKALLAAAKRAYCLETNDRFGVKAQRAKTDFAAVHARVHGVIDAIAPNDSKARFTGLGVRVIEGTSRFKDRRTVGVGEEFEIKARRFVIATGSSPAAPPIPGLEATPYLTNETIFDLTQCPKHLIVIGGGPIGLELAQAHRRLGTEVTVLEAATPLAKDDQECAAIVLDQLAREGIALRSGIKVLRVERRRGGRVRVILEGPGNSEEVLEGSHLLVATGRRANVSDLGLEAANIKFEDRGIRVDKRLKTSNRRVYAIGDVVLGGLQFTHVANYHAGLVIRNALFRLPVDAGKGVIPWVTFTDPELAHAGLREDEARQCHGTIRVLRWPYHENDRAQAERRTPGHIKAITDKHGRILGVTIVGAHAGELITMWTLAIVQGLKVKAMLGLIVPYPTFSEIGKRAALTYFTSTLTSPWVRRVISLLRRFG